MGATLYCIGHIGKPFACSLFTEVEARAFGRSLRVCFELFVQNVGMIVLPAAVFVRSRAYRVVKRQARTRTCRVPTSGFGRLDVAVGLLRNE